MSKFEKKIQEIEALVSQKAYYKVEKICRKLLKKKGNNGYLLHQLALSMYNQGKCSEAIGIYRRAILFNKKEPLLYNNMGCAFLAINNYKEAESCFINAVELDSVNSYYFSNLGDSCLRQKKYNEAKEYFLKAFELENKNTKAVVCLCVCHKFLGNLDEAVELLLLANKLDFENLAIYTNLVSTLLYSHRTQDAMLVALEGLKIAPPNSSARFELNIGVAISSWVLGKTEITTTVIRESREQPISLLENYKENKTLQNYVAYHTYLSSLLKEHATTSSIYDGEATKAIYFVGDSHCLSASESIVSYKDEQYRILSNLVQGGKAYHFAQKKKNVYKASVDMLFKALPNNSVVIVGFGEIDCRVNEGFLPKYLRGGGDYRDSIVEVVKRYTDYVIQLAKQFNHEVIFCGVPSLNVAFLPSLDGKKAKMLEDIIRCFNIELAKRISSTPYKLIDVYSYTESNKEKHKDIFIDDHHLYPKILRVLFDDHLTI